MHTLNTKLCLCERVTVFYRPSMDCSCCPKTTLAEDSLSPTALIGRCVVDGDSDWRIAAHGAG
jgi:hypothetical protein